MKIVYILLLCLPCIACGTVQEKEVVQIAYDQLYPDSTYEKYNLRLRPAANQRYRVSYNEFDQLGARKLLVNPDSVLYAKIAGTLGERAPKGRKPYGTEYIEDIYSFKNLAIFEVAKDIPDSFDFGRFKELRFVEVNTSVNLTNRQIFDLLNNSKKIRGLRVSIQDDLPKCICELRDLEYLEVFNKQLSNIPECIQDLPNLEYLYISGVPIELSDWVFSNSNLRFLRLENGEALQIPNSLGAMTNLKHLEIAFFRKIGLPRSFDGLEALELFELNNILDTLEIDSQLENMKNLLGVRMSHINLASFPRFENSNRLRYVNLKPINYLQPDSFSFEGISDSIEYVEVFLQSNSSINIFPTGLENATSLKHIILGGMPIEKVPRYLANMKVLKSLELHQSRIDYESLKFIYDRLHKNGLECFNPSFISGISDEQRTEIMMLDSEAPGNLTSNSRPDSFYDQAFDYYLKKIKFGIDSEWTNH